MHKILVFAFLLMLTLTVNLHAQEKKAQRYEEFKNKLDQRDPGLLLDDARKLKSTSASAALAKVEEALGLSLAGKDQLNEARSYVVLGEINESIQEWKLSQENHTIAYEKLKPKYSGTQDFKITLFGLGNTHLKLGNYEKAIPFFERLQKMNLTAEEGVNVQLGLSEVYYQMKNYDKAERAIEK